MERLFVECAVRAALIAVVTAVVIRTIGVRPAAVRHRAWTGVMLTMLLLPLWAGWGPKAPIRLLPALSQPETIEVPLTEVPTYSAIQTVMHPIETSGPNRAVHNWNWQSLLLAVYGLGALGLLARLAVGTARTRRLIRRTNVRDGKRISSECASPITVGWFHPVVILPENWQEWSPPQLDAVLTHEREHVRRHDPLIQWLALVNRALFWFHPLSWWLERKLAVLAEETCDAAVLARGHAPQDYSEYLLDIARSVSRSGSRLSIVGSAMPGSFLRQRIRQILNSCGAPRISRTRIVVAVAACAASSVLLASGTLEHAPSQVQLSTSDSVHSASLVMQTEEKKPEVVFPVARAQGNPKVLLAQATTNSQSVRTAPPLDSAEKERQLQDAFLRSNPITDMAIAMELNYFQLNRVEYFVPLTVRIPGRELVLAQNGGAQRASFDFIGEIKDSFGSTVQNLRDKVSMQLNGATVSQLSSTPIEYDTEFTLLPGRYSIKFLARNDETDRVGTYQTDFTVPNLNKEDQRIPISSVVLSSQHVAVPEAINNEGNTIRAANPLVKDGRKLIPSVTRVFSKSREMYVYLQAYQREAGDTQPLFASVTFYQGQVKALKTAPIEVTQGLDRKSKGETLYALPPSMLTSVIEVTQGLDPKSKGVPLSFSISLADLKPGDYTCQVTVWNPAGQKNAVWQAPVVIEP